MTGAVLVKLLSIFATVAIGWIAVRMRWFGTGAQAADPTRSLGNAAMLIFVPALLFRTMARLDVSAMPWQVVIAYFVPAVAYALAVYAWQRKAVQRPANAAQNLGPTAPAGRVVTATFGNGVQLGIPMAAALFGEPGLAIHLALVSVHGLILLTLPTVLAEMDRARHTPAASVWHTVRSTVRNTVIHPVVLPVLAGLAWNVTGLGLHPVVDQTLSALGAAVVPLCLVVIGMTLAVYGVRGQVRNAVTLSALKLLVLPALVLMVAHWGFGLQGLALKVAVVLAALPVGTNALIFAQRYRTLEAEATAAIVMSTGAFVLTATLWLAVLAALA
jgi:predicted permease